MATATDYQGERAAALREVEEADEEIAGLRGELEGLAFKARSDKAAARHYAETETALRNAKQRRRFAEAAAKGAETAGREAAERVKAEREAEHRRELDRISRERLALAAKADAALAEAAEHLAELERLREPLGAHARALGFGAQPQNRARHGLFEAARSHFQRWGVFSRQQESVPGDRLTTCEEAERANIGRFLLDEEGSK